MWLEIDVEPVRAALARELYGLLDQAGTQAASPIVGVNRRLKDRCVLAAIPGDVHEADEARPVVGTYADEAARENGGEVTWSRHRPDCQPGDRLFNTARQTLPAAALDRRRFWSGAPALWCRAGLSGFRYPGVCLEGAGEAVERAHAVVGGMKQA